MDDGAKRDENSKANEVIIEDENSSIEKEKTLEEKEINEKDALIAELTGKLEKAEQQSQNHVIKSRLEKKLLEKMLTHIL